MWLINERPINDGEECQTKWIFSSKKAEEKKEELIRTGTRFRLLDDDRVVYFYGYSTDNNSFDPLDCVGEGYGCTSIEYFENGQWETL